MWWFRKSTRTARRQFGDTGEALACRYLKKQCRMKILCRNVTYTDGELDIVALDGNDLVFVEVRTRSSENYASPEQSVNLAKRQTVAAAARRFIRTRRVYEFHPRFDVVAIVLPPGGTPEIRHHRNAFSFAGTQAG